MKKYFTGSLIVLWLVLCVFSGPIAGTFGVILALGGAVDSRERIIPNRVCISIALLGAFEIMTGPGESVKWKAFSVIIMWMLLLLMKLIIREGIGMGDVKLLMGCSFSLNMVSLMAGMAFACVTAAVTGIVSTKSLKGEVPLGPFLAVSLTLWKIAETM